MSRWYPCALVGALLLGSLPLAWRGRSAELSSGPAFHPGPSSVADAARRAEALGLHVVPGLVGRAIASDRAGASAHLAYMSINDPDFRGWVGRVAIYPQGRRTLADNYNPGHPERYALWGEVMLYGDPLLIQDLVKGTTAIAAKGAAARPG